MRRTRPPVCREHSGEAALAHELLDSEGVLGDAELSVGDEVREGEVGQVHVAGVAARVR